MRNLLAVFPLFALCGCLSSATVPSVSYWLMEFRDAPVAAKTPKYGVGRLSQVVVSSPYAGDRIVVLRRDGSVAFDDHNVFAATPPMLLKGVCLSALRTSGLFEDVVGVSSGASAAVSVEILVEQLALDCRQEDSRRAVAKVLVRVVQGRTIASAAEGADSVDASDGDYGVAFSKVVSSAVSSALAKLR